MPSQSKAKGSRDLAHRLPRESRRPHVAPSVGAASRATQSPDDVPGGRPIPKAIAAPQGVGPKLSRTLGATELGRANLSVAMPTVPRSRRAHPYGRRASRGSASGRPCIGPVVVSERSRRKPWGAFSPQTRVAFGIANNCPTPKNVWPKGWVGAKLGSKPNLGRVCVCKKGGHSDVRRRAVAQAATPSLGGTARVAGGPRRRRDARGPRPQQPAPRTTSSSYGVNGEDVTTDVTDEDVTKDEQIVGGVALPSMRVRNRLCPGVFAWGSRPPDASLDAVWAVVGSGTTSSRVSSLAGCGAPIQPLDGGLAEAISGCACDGTTCP